MVLNDYLGVGFELEARCYWLALMLMVCSMDRVEGYGLVVVLDSGLIILILLRYCCGYLFCSCFVLVRQVLGFLFYVVGYLLDTVFSGVLVWVLVLVVALGLFEGFGVLCLLLILIV